ncbi:MAG TPA: trypsin-like peptidase domain-containing protein [Terriglobales bacterium]|nr:trypsin-like peptidase domain-containing protein [Terriglobales bacterium]
MDFGTDKVLVVEADRDLREHVAKILTDAGYQVSAEFAVTLKTVLAYFPDVIVLGASPPQLDCCDLLAEVKRSEQACHIRVIMLAPGGAAERVRGLDLGADDVLSLPLDDRELLARVRTQLREKRPEDELRETVRNGRNSQRDARRVLRALDRGRRTLRIGVALLIVCALLATGGLSFLYWRSQKQNVRVYTALAKLQTGIASERDMLQLARRARTQIEQNAINATETQRQNLKRQSRELHDKLATADPNQTAELERQLRAANERLQKLETESTVAQDVIRSYSASVCLLHVVVGFRDKGSGLTLRYRTITPAGSPLANANGETQVQLGGIGPEVRMDAFGTGFLASGDGRIVTNHHVVEPWWKNDDIGELLKQAAELEPMVVEMTAYFPGVSHGIPVTLQKISSDADLAVVAGNISGLKVKLLEMDASPKAAVSGEPVVLIGYPTGVDAIFARTSEDAMRSIAANTNGDSKSLMTELAHRNLIRPVNTQGHIGDVLADKIIYDAQTTSGGSGGPLFNAEGKVIAVNVAMLRDFGGSNFAIPVRYAKPLLPR